MFLTLPALRQSPRNDIKGRSNVVDQVIPSKGTFVYRIIAILHSDKRAVTAVEYGLVTALIGGVGFIAFTSLGTSLRNALANITF